MYGIPVPPGATPQQPIAGPGQQGQPTQAPKPQWGGQGYQNQYMQQRQQMMQQLANMQRPNAPMPGQGGPQGAPQGGPPMGGPQMPPMPMQRPGMADGGPIQYQTMPQMMLRGGLAHYATGGPASMQDVQQVPLSVGTGPQRALVAQAPMAQAPQAAIAAGQYQPIDKQAILAGSPSPANMSDYQRNKLGVFTADSTPQYFGAGSGTTPRTVQNQLGPLGQPGAPPPPQPTAPAPAASAAPSNDQIQAMIAADFAQQQQQQQANIERQQQLDDQKAGPHKTGGPIDQDFTGGGQPLDINAGRKRDTIPAMLDSGEYVFTRKAVRGVGGGDIHVGAKRLGALMRRYEGQDTDGPHQKPFNTPKALS